MALPYDHISDSPHVQINFLCALLLARVLLGMKEDLPQCLDNFVVKLQGTGRCEQPYRENGWRVGVLARRKKINWWSRDATTVASMRVPHNYPQYMFTNLYMLMFMLDCHICDSPGTVPSRIFSPPAKWGLLDFKIAFRASFFSSSPPRLFAYSLPRQLMIAVGTAGPQLPAPDPSGRRCTSTTIFRYQWALLGLNRGPLESRGHRWTSTGDLPNWMGTAGPQPEMDLNR